MAKIETFLPRGLKNTATLNNRHVENLHPDNNQLDDPEVYKNVYWEGNWAGVFQFVQPPVQKFVKKMKPESILDIASATSIFRPGPLGIGADKSRWRKLRPSFKGV